MHDDTQTPKRAQSGTLRHDSRSFRWNGIAAARPVVDGCPESRDSSSHAGGRLPVQLP